MILADVFLNLFEIFDGGVAPLALQASLDRHQAKFLNLKPSMQLTGIDERQIDTGIELIVTSYKEELTNTMNSLNRVTHA